MVATGIGKTDKIPIIKEISHKDEMYSIRNIANNVIVSLYGDRTTFTVVSIL